MNGKIKDNVYWIVYSEDGVYKCQMVLENLTVVLSGETEDDAFIKTMFKAHDIVNDCLRKDYIDRMVVQFVYAHTMSCNVDKYDVKIPKKEEV